MASNCKESGPTKRPLHQKIAFGCGFVFPKMVLALWYAYSVAFFQKVLGLPARSTGTIVLIGQCAGAISSPLMGLWSDQLSSRCGRRKITHLIGSICMALPYFFIWQECITCADAPSVYQMIYFASFTAVLLFGTSVTEISMYALIPELAADEHANIELNAIGYTHTSTLNC